MLAKIGEESAGRMILSEAVLGGGEGDVGFNSVED